MKHRMGSIGFRSAWARSRAFGLAMIFVLLAATSAQAASTPQVGVYYFDGWANATARNTHMKNLPEHFRGRKPLCGWYDNSAALVHQQIEWAREAGATFFIFDWYDIRRLPNSPDRTLNSAVTYFRRDPQKQGMKYALLYVNNGIFNIPRADWKAACQRWVDTDFKNPSYFRINGKPLIVVFSVHDMEKTWGGPRGVAKAWNVLRETAKKAGLPGVFVVACATPGRRSPKKGWTRLTGMSVEGYDAYSGYNYPGVPGTVNGENPYSVLVRGSIRIWNDFAADGRKPYIPIVTDGWDPRPWNETPYWYKRSPEEFHDFVVEALRWWRDHPKMRVMRKTPLIFVEAWNELGEGSYIVPTHGDRFAYTKALKRALEDAEKYLRHGK